MHTAPQHPLPTSAPRGGRHRRACKAALAGVVAVGLLAAGGGTFSKWYDEEAVASGDVLSSGELSLDHLSSGWFADGQPIDVDTFRMVPGDTVTFVSQTRVNAVGDSLTAQLALDPSGISLATVDPGLAEDLVYAVDVDGLQDTSAAGGWTVVGEAGGNRNDNGAPVTVTVTIDWPADVPADGRAGQNDSVDLGALKLTLAQNV
jgi:alternate signal-mediated exported protein